MTPDVARTLLAGLLALGLAGCDAVRNLGGDALTDSTTPPAAIATAETEGGQAGSGERADPDRGATTGSQPALSMEKVEPPTGLVDAVEHPDRPADDVALDPARKPLDVMSFAGIEDGQTLLELEAGSGYFTELLARAVGPSGRIYMHNPPAFDAFLGNAVDERLSGRLTNVTVLKTNFDRLPLPDNSVDIVTWFQGPHELWYMPEGADGPLGDPEATFAAIARVLRPGGTFVVLDHRAPAGAPPSTGGETHRIDPAIILDLARQAGFTVDGESDVLRNESDDLLLNVFDERVRRKTDQFLIAFSKG